MEFDQFPFLKRLLDADDDDDSSLQKSLQYLREGNFHALLTSPLGSKWIDLEESENPTNNTTPKALHEIFTHHVVQKLELLLQDQDQRPGNRIQLLCIGIAALHAFLQANVTGPPLGFKSEDVAIPESLRPELQELRKSLIQSLTVDGEAAYALIPHVELFVIARCVLNHPAIAEGIVGARWARVRVNFLHQRLLEQGVQTLQARIYADLASAEEEVFSLESGFRRDARVQFLLERAAINTYYGFDGRARGDLERASGEMGFEYVLTGALGRRTRWQDRDLSQLVVIARSADDAMSEDSRGKSTEKEPGGANGTSKPQNLDLNDDTLLESISFTSSLNPTVTTDSSLPPALATLDPANQPLLSPLDSILLLSLASSIKNTSPEDGLTREETLPYATRVLEGGSSNWQIYTQALLVRSRIEGYKSRTVERGVLQLQALVDQVVADTTTTITSPTPTKDNDNKEGSSNLPTTFLPRPTRSESAPASERLKYIYALSSPPRWALEAELAARWVSLGGLRTALEIYERLHMWAEVALCWAAVEREDKARVVVRRELYLPTTEAKGDPAGPVEEDGTEMYDGVEREPLPGNSPRLFCILGDIDKNPRMYERAWEVSNGRYARAQRSLGRHYAASKDYRAAASAYAKSLKINRLNHSTWFALGCIQLELEEWEGAVESFIHTVQLEDGDAEAWSNLAASLLKLPAMSQSSTKDVAEELDGEKSGRHEAKVLDPEKSKRDALSALKRAARLKHDDFRIWDNILTVAAGMRPPSYSDVVFAQKRVIEIRGKSVGERAVDEDVLILLVRHVVSTDFDQVQEEFSKMGIPGQVIDLVEKDVVPLITKSARLWRVVAQLELWRKRPGRALEASEKAWRAVTMKKGAYDESEKRWDEVVDTTVELVGSYESLGPMERETGEVGGDAEAELVARDWKFKARSAVRGVMGKGKEMWESTTGWERLKETLEDLKGSGAG